LECSLLTINHTSKTQQTTFTHSFQKFLSFYLNNNVTVFLFIKTNPAYTEFTTIRVAVQALVEHCQIVQN